MPRISWGQHYFTIWKWEYFLILRWIPQGGVIRCPDLRNSSEEEILEGTRSQGVTAVKRFKIKRNGQLKDTNTFVFTFNTPTLPKTVKVAYFRVTVEINIPNPLRCHSCQKYGHHENRCTKDPICANCGEPANHTEQNCGNTPSCVNCGKKHSANSKECLAQRKRNVYCKIHCGEKHSAN